jgi:hypothetical protein
MSRFYSNINNNNDINIINNINNNNNEINIINSISNNKEMNKPDEGDVLKSTFRNPAAC